MDIARYSGAAYTFVYNLQGDVVAIQDSTGATVVEYKYNAWGKLLAVTGSMASTLGRQNPIRYRGYEYDEESGLYYLRSRYYNPDTGRFISADIINCGNQLNSIFVLLHYMGRKTGLVDEQM